MDIDQDLHHEFSFGMRNPSNQILSRRETLSPNDARDSRTDDHGSDRDYKMTKSHEKLGKSKDEKNNMNYYEALIVDEVNESRQNQPLHNLSQHPLQIHTPTFTQGAQQSIPQQEYPSS